MTAIDKNFHSPTPAPHAPFTPTSTIPRSTVQAAIEYVYSWFAALVPSAGAAPKDAQYLVAAADGTLSAERVTTDTTSITWDHATAAQAKAKRAALTGDVTAGADSNATTIADNAVSDAKLRDSAAVSVIGRSANSSGDPADIAAAANDTLLRRVSDALSFGALTIGMFGANLVTYAKIQQVSATSRFLGRITSGAGDIEELTGTQATSLLSNVVGDSGSGGTKGLVPAPGAGDAAAGKFFNAAGAFSPLSSITPHGDSDYTILATDRVAATSAALTAARAWTLPAVSGFPAGLPLWVIDLAGGVTGTNTLTIQRAGSDTIDGGTTIVLRGAYGSVALVGDGSSKWKLVAVRAASRLTSYTSGSGTHTTLPGCSTLVASVWGAGGGSSGSGTSAPAGSTGGNTTFGSLTGAGGVGGSRGDVSGVGGAGGAGSGGDVNISGQLGGGGQNAVSQPGGFGGGAAAIGIWTQGGTPGAVGVAGVANTGAGAGAAGSGGAAAPAGGGGGGGGYTKKVIVGPATSYSYAVGAGGSGGTAGTSGFAGAQGGSGLIVVEEYTD